MSHKITIGKMFKPDYFVQSEIDRLRVNIGFVGANKKVIMITSTTANEGKSYVSVLLWNELAKAGKRVCFVDADMRKSALRASLRLHTDQEEFTGLSHYLAGSSELQDIIYATEENNAAFIPTITMINPNLLLEGDRMDYLLQTLRKDFDYIIVDTPPMGLVSDGQSIAAKCDGCLLVVRAHETARKAAQSTVRKLNQANCPLLGVVLNRVSDKKSKRYIGGKYGYYKSGYYAYYH